MGVTDIPKAIYKAQQAKKKMSQLQAASRDGVVSILLNGLNEIEEVEISAELIMEMFPALDAKDAKKLADELSKNIKKSFADAKKQIEKQLIESTNMDDLKELLSGN